MNAPEPSSLRSDEDATTLREVFQAQQAIASHEPTPSAAVRRDRLKRLVNLLETHASRIEDALMSDFGYRAREQTYFVEVMTTAKPIRNAIRQVEKWMRPERRSAGFPFNVAGARAEVQYQPLGVVGCISPWNFPINLTFSPLAGILAAGNRAMVKPSELTPASAALLAEMIGANFDRSEVAVIEGGVEVARQFVELPFDHLIYTGGEAVAKSIMRAAADNLVPLTLELGGKSPVIIGEGASMSHAATRIMFGKTFNAGQICLAPDHVFVKRSELPALVDALREATGTMLPEARAGQDFVSVVNDRHAERLRGYVDEARQLGAEVISFDHLGQVPEGDGGNIVPITLLIDPPASSRVMGEEVFGPVLPVIPYDDIDDAIAAIRRGPKPLAIYFFGKDSQEVRAVLDNTRSGGVTINDVIMHYTVEDLPFGGVGASGYGAYHGKSGFRQFSHARAVYRQSPFDLGKALRPPYGKAFETMSRFLFRWS